MEIKHGKKNTLRFLFLFISKLWFHHLTLKLEFVILCPFSSDVFIEFHFLDFLLLPHLGIFILNRFHTNKTAKHIEKLWLFWFPDCKNWRKNHHSQRRTTWVGYEIQWKMPPHIQVEFCCWIWLFWCCSYLSLRVLISLSLVASSKGGNWGPLQLAFFLFSGDFCDFVTWIEKGRVIIF